MRQTALPSLLLLVLPLLGLSGATQLAAEAKPSSDLSSAYIERYFATFPTRATASGRQDRDHELERLGVADRKAWADYQDEMSEAIAKKLEGTIGIEERRDLELLRRQVALERIRWQQMAVPESDPLFWTGIASQATVFLLVREDRPASSRLDAAADRASQLPRLLGEAREALDLSGDGELSPDLLTLAASQIQPLALFYREGFPLVAESEAESLITKMDEAGEKAADAIDTFASYLEERASSAIGSARAGGQYEELFRTYTDLDKGPQTVLKEALADLEAKRQEAATYGRTVWPEILGEEKPPEEDSELLRRLFRKIESNHATDVEAFVADYRQLSDASFAFVAEHDVVTLPGPLPIWIGTSPDFFVGQGVGGVYPPGPYAPGSPTLLFLPTPPSDASEEQMARLFGAFNHAFNTMITPHELVPGHTLQLASAARHPRKIRAIFPDDVYVEGWGTFAERLMLDLGWGDSSARLAHLKKQLENIARLIVDIRVHSTDAGQEEILAFVRDEALQDEQFARNMWMRAITSSPQLTTYHLGYRQVMGLFQDVQRAKGGDFDTKAFLDGMMELGPVPVREYRALMLSSSDPSSRDRAEEQPPD